MTQDVDIQLQVWKDLAISKQILMGAATDALGLDAECSTAELKLALNQAIKRAKDADASIVETRSLADQQIADMKQQMEQAIQAREEADSNVETAFNARETAERQLLPDCRWCLRARLANPLCRAHGTRLDGASRTDGHPVAGARA